MHAGYYVQRYGYTLMLIAYSTYALYNGNQLDQHYEESFLVVRGEGGTAAVWCNTRISFNAIASVNNNIPIYIYVTASFARVHTNNKHSV